MKEKKYYGDAIIESYSILDEFKTRNGDDYYQLNLSNGKIEIIPKIIFDSCVTNEPGNATDLINNRMNILLVALLDIFKEFNIKIQEVPYMAQKLSNTINMLVDDSDSILWGKNINDKTFQDVDAVLKKKRQTLDNIK